MTDHRPELMPTVRLDTDGGKTKALTRYLWVLDGDVVGVGLTWQGARAAAATYLESLFDGEPVDVAELDVDTDGYAMAILVVAPADLVGEGWHALLGDLEGGAGIELGAELPMDPA